MQTLIEMLTYIKYTLVKVFSPSLVKSTGVFFYVIYAFLLDVTQYNSYVALLVLILLDFITGVYAAKKSGEAIRSGKVRHSAIKVMAYFAVISGAHVAENGIPAAIAFIDETVLAFFLITELISLIENVGRMGYETPKKILNQLKEYKERA